MRAVSSSKQTVLQTMMSVSTGPTTCDDVRTDRLIGLLLHAIAIAVRMVRGVPRGVLWAYIHIYIRVTQHTPVAFAAVSQPMQNVLVCDDNHQDIVCHH